MEGEIVVGFAVLVIGPACVAELWVVAGLILVRLGRREERAWVVEQKW